MECKMVLWCKRDERGDRRRRLWKGERRRLLSDVLQFLRKLF